MIHAPKPPMPYEPTEAELQALGARLFGLAEHQPGEDDTRPLRSLFHGTNVASVARKEDDDA